MQSRRKRLDTNKHNAKKIGEMILHGRNLIIKLGGVAIAGARSCEFNVQSDSIEKSSSTQGQFKEYIGGRLGWTCTCGHLVSEISGSASLVGRTVVLRCGSRGDTDYIEGRALVTSWKATGTVGSLTQGSFSFLGTGVLSYTGNPEDA